MRNFKTDFLTPAITGLRLEDAMRVSLALDCAIAFGALERSQGNVSLQDDTALEKTYQEKCARLKTL